ncbi:TFIID-31kDa-domain-containing protein [Polyporus arcularius HHB13444]|uniref:TFIID-31kDa-domain-containing protein n=1 Tax=Polyporus arcularius HHB13444 TaxID=1314778 RepID=A0A5C3PYN3_9APHY|nr:TFIID-31kDa-domain-containing protein [Polyporus arcularius HHB13444]
MSRQAVADTIPPSARAIALLLASTPTVQDAQPGVLHQLLEFSNRYTAQVLSDALVYAEHAGRSGKVEMEDVVLAVQARVGWEFGGRVPKEYMLSLATQTNSVPLPSVPEVYGVRLPPPSECLTAVDFDLVPNKPPPGVKLFDEEIEEVEESESDDDDMEPAPLPAPQAQQQPQHEAEEDDGLFAGGDEEEEESADEAMEDVTASGGVDAANGMKRKLVEEEDYD